MAIYNLGKIGMNPCGAYSATKQYSKLDVVSYNGGSYMALSDCVGVAPTATDKWMVLAQGSASAAMTLNMDADSKFNVSGLAPVLRVSGNVVQLEGDITPKSSISGGTTYLGICTIPLQYAPHNDICTLQQGTTQQVWMLRIFNRNHESAAGKAMFARCRQGSSWKDISAGNWLPFHTTWVI